MSRSLQPTETIGPDCDACAGNMVSQCFDFPVGTNPVNANGFTSPCPFGVASCSEACSITQHCTSANNAVAVVSDGYRCICTCALGWSGPDCGTCEWPYELSRSSEVPPVCDGCAGNSIAQCFEQPAGQSNPRSGARYTKCGGGTVKSCEELCDVVDHCSGQAAEVNSDGYQCVCSCRNGWTGSDCSVCPSTYDQSRSIQVPEPDCDACAGNMVSQCFDNPRGFNPGDTSGEFQTPCIVKSCAEPCTVVKHCSGPRNAVAVMSDGYVCQCICALGWSGPNCADCESPYDLSRSPASPPRCDACEGNKAAQCFAQVAGALNPMTGRQYLSCAYGVESCEDECSVEKHCGAFGRDMDVASDGYRCVCTDVPSSEPTVSPSSSSPTAAPTFFPSRPPTSFAPSLPPTTAPPSWPPSSSPASSSPSLNPASSEPTTLVPTAVWRPEVRPGEPAAPTPRLPCDPFLRRDYDYRGLKSDREGWDPRRQSRKDHGEGHSHDESGMHLEPCWRSHWPTSVPRGPRSTAAPTLPGGGGDSDSSSDPLLLIALLVILLACCCCCLFLLGALGRKKRGEEEDEGLPYKEWAADNAEPQSPSWRVHHDTETHQATLNGAPTFRDPWPAKSVSPPRPAGPPLTLLSPDVSDSTGRPPPGARPLSPYMPPAPGPASYPPAAPPAGGGVLSPPRPGEGVGMLPLISPQGDAAQPQPRPKRRHRRRLSTTVQKRGTL